MTTQQYLNTIHRLRYECAKVAKSYSNLDDDRYYFLDLCKELNRVEFNLERQDWRDVDEVIELAQQALDQEERRQR